VAGFTIQGPGDAAAAVRVTRCEGPFTLRPAHAAFTMRAHSYVLLPVRFRPPAGGPPAGTRVAVSPLSTASVKGVFSDQSAPPLKESARPSPRADGGTPAHATA
jgi:hypothetical protein